MIHYLRFFFEAGVDTPLWPEDMCSPYGYPCDLARLPISPDTGRAGQAERAVSVVDRLGLSAGSVTAVR